jgi:hypothetical protein
LDTTISIGGWLLLLLSLSTTTKFSQARADDFRLIKLKSSLTAKFHVSFMIGDDQLRFQQEDRVKQAGMSTGYRFRLARFETNGQVVRGTVENVGIAPIYYDAYPVVAGKQLDQSLKGLLSGRILQFQLQANDAQPSFSIACKRLVDGQEIQWETKPE